MELPETYSHITEVQEKILLPAKTWIRRLSELPHGGIFAPPQMRYITVSCSDGYEEEEEEDEEDSGDVTNITLDDEYTPPTTVSLVDYAFPVGLFGGRKQSPGLFPSDEKHFSCVTIQRIYVDERHRRQGVATFVIREIIKLAKEHKKHKLVCIESVMTPEMHLLIEKNFPSAFKLASSDNTYYIIV